MPLTVIYTESELDMELAVDAVRRVEGVEVCLPRTAAAAFLQITERGLAALTANGKLSPCDETLGQCIFYKVGDLKEYQPNLRRTKF